MINGKPNPHHELWSRWCSIKTVCYNTNNANYSGYGGRGIKMCRRWKDSFEDFVEDIESTIGPVPFAGAHLDRIDNNGDYTVKNMRWSTPRENYNNRRSNHWVTFQGKRQTLAEWSRETGIPLRTIWSRLMDYGLPPKQVFQKARLKRV